MRVYLDDERNLEEFLDRVTQLGYEVPKTDWIACRWPDEVIEHLKTGQVTVLSLDHDLGDKIYAEVQKRKERKGMDVLTWMEDQVLNHGFKPPLHIIVHSMNPVGSRDMIRLVFKIQKDARERGLGM
jgi:hypothetical protein